MAKILVATSDKGDVGKTTTSTTIGTGLALRGLKTTIIDFGVDLRDPDPIIGRERRVVYNSVNVINGEATLTQALIKGKCLENLYILVASRTCDEDTLTKEGVEKVMAELHKNFEYVICDSPTGTKKDAHLTMYPADEAIVMTDSEASSVRDSDCMFGLLASKSQRAEKDEGPIKEHLLLARYNLERVIRGGVLDVDDAEEILAVRLLGMIPESQAVLKVLNQDTPATLGRQSNAGQAYSDAADHLLSKEMSRRFLDVQERGLL